MKKNVVRSDNLHNRREFARDVRLEFDLAGTLIPDKLRGTASLNLPLAQVHGLVCDQERQHPLPLRWRKILSTDRQTDRETV